MEQCINLHPVSLRLLQANLVNIMVADALAPCVTRPSATIVLTTHGKQAHVIH